MEIHLRISSIPLMLAFLMDLKKGKANRMQITNLFNHPDYVFEFDRYGVLSKDKIIDYFLRVNDIDEAEIPSLSTERKTTLKDKHKIWLSAYENPEKYSILYDEISGLLTEDYLKAISERCKKGLPFDTDIVDVTVISTMSIGMSFGYVYKDALHFDIMQLDHLGNLPSLISHEMHHLAMWSFVSRFIDELTLEERYIFNFSGEGLAIKFCNNAKGSISKPLYRDTPVNEGLDVFSINYLNDRFMQSWDVFDQTLANIRAGKMNKEDVFKQFEDYWWNSHVDGQNENDTPLLKQSRIYTFGNDLYGSIYDAFGSKTLFDCVRHPLKAVEYFRSILTK